jgi:hypothetical protein
LTVAVIPVDGVPVPLLTGPWQVAHVLMVWLCDDGGRLWQAPQLATAVASVQGAVYVQACERTGVPPVQPAGDDVATVRVCVLFDWQAPQAE